MIKKIPSLTDFHVHFRDPGFLDKETIETGLKAAIKGGFGTVLVMPNTNPVNDNSKVTKYMLEKAEAYKNLCNYLPVSAVTYNLDSKDLVNFDEMKKAGCPAFSNDGLPVSDTDVFKKALMTGELILSHLEDETKEAIEQIKVYKEVLEGAKFGKNKFPRLHFCHISKKATLEVIKRAKDEGLNITAETCPHYFTFTKNDVDKTGRFKMNPPLGTLEDKEAVIEALKTGIIDIISTDHAPHLESEKLCLYNEAKNGITGLETAFSLTYTKFGLDFALEKMVFAPNKILGAEPKREIEVDLDETFIVKGGNFQSKCKITPYENMKLKGIIK